MRIPSGVPGFDRLLHGGLPSGAAIVVQGPAGREKDAILFQFVVEGLQRGGAALVVLSSVSTSTFREDLRAAGVDVDRVIAEARLRFVDWFSYKEDAVQDIQVDGPTFKVSIDLANVGIAISRAIAALPREKEMRAAVEVLSPALSFYELENVYAFAQSTKAKLEKFGFTSLFVLEKDLHDERTVSSIHQPFDGVVDIKRIREGDQLVRKIAVLSLKGAEAESKYVPVDVGADDLVRVLATSEREQTLLQEELVKTDPKDPRILLATARNFHEMGKDDQALKCVNAALRLNSKDAAAWWFKAGVLDALGRDDAAKKARHRAATLSPLPVEQEEPAPQPVPVVSAEPVDEQALQRATDAETLFATAEHLATGEDIAGAIKTLEILATVDDAYPGLWALLATLHANRGDEEEAYQADLRALEVDRREGRHAPPAEARHPREAPAASACPACGADVGDGDSRCPICGAVFEDEETVAKQSPRSKPNRGAPFLGLTNGLAQRTTRGAGRTNGLVNGTRDRTSGMTNGLATGLLSMRSGMTNGLTDASGFTNGLGSVRLRHESRAARWKLYLLPLLASMLILLPLFGPVGPGVGGPITIDGNLGDWDTRSLAAQAPGPGMNLNADILRWGATDNENFVAFAAEVNGQALRGGDAPPTTDRFTIFLDTDRDPSTGYGVDGWGADSMVEIAGWGGVVNQSLLYDWDAGRDASDWRGWVRGAPVPAAVSGAHLEVEVDWSMILPEKGPLVAIIHAQGFDGSVDTGDFSVNPLGGSLVIREQSVVPDTILNPGAPLIRLNMTAFRADAELSGLTVTLTGSASPAVVTALQLVDEDGVLVDERIPVNRQVPFQFASRFISQASPQAFFVIAEVSSSSGDTLGARLAGAEEVLAGTAAVTVRNTLSVRDVGYLGVIQTSPRVDGGHAEWTNVDPDPTGDEIAGPDPDIDLRAFAAQSDGNASFFFARSGGTMFAGTWIPERNTLASPATLPPPDQDRDTVPDALDSAPFDFDNDGVSDADEGGDADGDGVTDYGQPGGTDLWLNTTIPLAFPAPYSGMTVRQYIGPIDRPYTAPDDILRVFVDLDNRSWTGFAQGGLGADRMIEISGTRALVRASGLYAFDGSYPGQWAWRWVSDVPLELGFDRIEFGTTENVTAAGSPIFVEIGATLNSRDSMSAATRGTRSSSTHVSSFDVAPSPTPSASRSNGQRATPEGVGPTPLDIGGNQALYLRNTNHGTEVACNYNKVASATQGPGPVRAISLTTGQDACWYLDATTGTTIPAGSWESLLDVSKTDEIGAIAYRSNTGTGISFPKQLDWTGSAWGTPETELATAGSSNQDFRVIWDTATDSTLFWILLRTFNDRIHAYKCTNVDSCTKEDVDPSSGNDYATAETVGVVDPERHWDAAIEASSGELLLVYDNPAASTNDFCYRTRSSGSSGTWSAETCFDHSSIASTNPGIAYITLANNPGSNRIGMGAFDTTNDDFVVGVWDGSAWVNADKAVSTAVTLTASWGGTVLAEDASNEFVAYAGNGVDSIAECEWTSAGGWESTCATFDPNTASGNDLKIMFATPLPGTDKGMVCQGDDLADDTCWRWSGVSGTGGTRGTIQVLTADDSSTTTIDNRKGFAWNPDQSGTSDGLAVYYETTSGSLSYNTYNDATDGWGTASTFTSAGSHKWIKLFGTGSAGNTNKVFVVTSNSNFDILAYRWTGSGAPANEQSITADTTKEDYQYWDLAFATNPSIQYDVRIEIWNKATDTVDQTIGTCLDVTTYGDDVQCLISGAAQTTLTSSQVVRIRVAHSSAFSAIKIDYDDADSTGDSRATIPPIGIPEFEDIVVPGLAMVLVPVAWRWSRRRERTGRRRGVRT